MRPMYRVGGSLALGLAVTIGVVRAQQAPDPQAGIDVAEIVAAAKAQGASGPSSSSLKKFRDFSEVTGNAQKLD